MTNLQRVVKEIRPPDQGAMEAARRRQDSLTKPPGSLGRLEELSVQLAGIRGGERPRIRNKVIVTMAGDHGVTAQGVTLYPSEVTAQMVRNFLRGGAGVNVLARFVGARVVVVDLGVAADLTGLAAEAPQTRFVIAKVRPGTADMSAGPAMSREQALNSLSAGIQVVEDELEGGIDILGVGEMGIGNTTAAAAIAAVFTRAPAAEVTGRGTGLDDTLLAHKIRVVERALAVNQPNPHDAVDVLARVGGLEIGGMAGAMLAAAAHRIPVVIDGFISGAAALVACALAPNLREYLIASHRSVEIGHGHILRHLDLEPIFNLNLRLGEGTGAALGIALAEAAARILDEMATFADAGIADAGVAGVQAAAAVAAAVEPEDLRPGVGKNGG